jgi:hypothetical protein
MHITRRQIPLAGSIVAVAIVFCSTARAGEYDFAGPYFRRIEGVTQGAGNAKEVNSVTHTIDPWPRYAPNRRIPANGERMSGAIERYRDVRKMPLGPAAIGLSGPASTGAAAPAATGAPAQ